MWQNKFVLTQTQILMWDNFREHYPKPRDLVKYYQTAKCLNASCVHSSLIHACIHWLKALGLSALLSTVHLKCKTDFRSILWKLKLWCSLYTIFAIAKGSSFQILSYFVAIKKSFPIFKKVKHMLTCLIKKWVCYSIKNYYKPQSKRT